MCALVLLRLCQHQLLRTRENPEYKYTLAFLGYGPEEDNCVLELTYNWGKESYTKGNGYAQVRAGKGVMLLVRFPAVMSPEGGGADMGTHETSIGLPIAPTCNNCMLSDEW
jgi:hypothetical protein